MQHSTPRLAVAPGAEDRSATCLAAEAREGAGRNVLMLSSLVTLYAGARAVGAGVGVSVDTPGAILFNWLASMFLLACMRAAVLRAGPAGAMGVMAACTWVACIVQMAESVLFGQPSWHLVVTVLLVGLPFALTLTPLAYGAAAGLAITSVGLWRLAQLGQETAGGGGGGALAGGFPATPMDRVICTYFTICGGVYVALRQLHAMRSRSMCSRIQVEDEQRAQRQLLERVIPAPFISQLRSKERIMSTCAGVSVMFIEVVSVSRRPDGSVEWHKLSERATAGSLHTLNDIFDALETVTSEYGVYKVETIGSEFMVRGGRLI